ncbi:hypothetical protein [Arthrobacter sp. NIO-1057]|uniref:hypothetical protein n=1 Tax=Arthrobacter sp. NIO-1057 TaxID=993071 RepID=UPI00071C6930|nr:hypothetical protein [Arthrobacter sp. NIO-1057]KSU66364.1 hypothetical protein AS038_06655 [Arthrobacter sp. NIO-1057]SCC12180.1 hypothetical protein GA0061084_1348 [Arthrobacter sp. NIO-1057]
MKTFHWWMASLTALFVIGIPVIIGVIPPIDDKTDDLLFQIGLISVLLGVSMIIVWVCTAVEDWFSRWSSGAPIRHNKR